MSILTELRAALDEYQSLVCADDCLVCDHLQRCNGYRTAYRILLTDDTIRALLDVAEAADIFCACERGGEPISRMSMEAALASLVKEADDALET